MEFKNLLRTIIRECLYEGVSINEDVFDEPTYLYGKDLPLILDYLKSLGLKTRDYDLDNETNIAGNPIVRDGLDGIRATYDNRRGRDRLSIWFTNGFESKDNTVRQKVESFINTLPKHH